jgi:hypothetical protein
MADGAEWGRDGDVAGRSSYLTQADARVAALAPALSGAGAFSQEPTLRLARFRTGQLSELLWLVDYVRTICGWAVLCNHPWAGPTHPGSSLHDVRCLPSCKFKLYLL